MEVFVRYTGAVGGCSVLLDFEILQEDNYFPRYTTFTRTTAELHCIFRHFFLLNSKKYVVEYQNLVATVPVHCRTEFVKYEIDPRHCKPRVHNVKYRANRDKNVFVVLRKKSDSIKRKDGVTYESGDF